MRPRLLDLYCGAGGAARGYQQAGFYVVGIDNVEQPKYVGDEFYRADALGVLRCMLEGRYDPFDAIHASPPCQAYTPMSNRWRGKGGIADERPLMISETRAMLRATGLPYVIENVMGARRYMDSPSKLCGRSVGLPIHRHRLFETNWPLMVPSCTGGRDPFGVYGKLDGRRLWTRPDGSIYRAARSLTEAREAMGMPWADWDGIREAVPPAMTEWVGARLLEHLARTPALAAAGGGG